MELYDQATDNMNLKKGKLFLDSPIGGLTEPDQRAKLLFGGHRENLLLGDLLLWAHRAVCARLNANRLSV